MAAIIFTAGIFNPAQARRGAARWGIRLARFGEF
jgi:hypothetical protein